ncbi:MAG: GNVR domain-containing protein, partial [Vicinamibacteraceae bacterium]
ARVADLERRLAQLTKQHDLENSSLPLLSKLYESQRRIARLETDLEIARAVYVDVATRHERARVQVASRSARLLVIDPAVAPTVPVSRHVLRNLALGAVAGLLLAMAYALLSPTITALRQTPA